jgi:hypothetical protein
MTTQKERILIIFVFANLLVIAAIGYSVEWESVPGGIVIPTAGGPVKFNHDRHMRHGSPGLSCVKCHHMVIDAAGGKVNADTKKCRNCHYYKSTNIELGKEITFGCPDAPVHKKCMGQLCTSCHYQNNCGRCHH